MNGTFAVSGNGALSHSAFWSSLPAQPSGEAIPSASCFTLQFMVSLSLAQHSRTASNILVSGSTEVASSPTRNLRMVCSFECHALTHDQTA
mgnify:CR=1 FL=1